MRKRKIETQIKPAEMLEDDWAPQLPSIWDTNDPDDDEHTADPPWIVGIDRSANYGSETWLVAEASCGRALAAAAAAVARLDERLLCLDPSALTGARLRIALESVPDLLWSEGVRLRPERLALAGADRVGGGEDAGTIARALWAVRRMVTHMPLDATPSTEQMRRFLGLTAPPGTDARDSPGVPDLATVDPAALEEWCEILAHLNDVHHLSRAVAAGGLWQTLGVTSLERLLEPAMIVAHLGAGAGQGGLAALPLAPSRMSGRADATARMSAGLIRIADGARTALSQLDRVAAWQRRASDATEDMPGRARTRLIELLAARPIISASLAAGTLDLTDRHARRLLSAFEVRGLVRELTGHSRFRYWTAGL